MFRGEGGEPCMCVQASVGPLLAGLCSHPHTHRAATPAHQCSKPMDTKAELGRKMPTNLPAGGEQMGVRLGSTR